MHLLFDELNEENFIIYAAKNYNNPACVDVDEFYDDLARFEYLKRLFRKYQASGILQERLILNHLIVLFNVFGIDAGTRMVFYKFEEEHWPVVKTFMLYLNYMKDSDYVDIPVDKYVADTLRKI